jgi:hypothetical protein
MMSLDRKLALRGRPIVVVNAPAGSPIRSRGDGIGEPALLVFVSDRTALEKLQKRILTSASADRLTWVAYPKGGQLGTDLQRDSLAGLLTPHGVRPVTQISLDSTWSALRFRPGNLG